MKIFHWIPFLVVFVVLAADYGGCEKQPELGDPLPGLNREELKLWKRGQTVFERVFTPETGLGPLFNADSCAECHEDPVAGGTGDESETHVAAFLSGGVCDLLFARGGPVIQQVTTPALRAALGLDSEPVPAEATGRATRTTPDLFGFGLLDAVPDSAILALADPDDRDGDGISGRANRDPNGRVGRFGRKAAVADLREFNDGAFLFEQGITSKRFPAEETIGGQPLPAGVDPAADPEINEDALEAADAFVRFLAPPAPLPLNEKAQRGRRLFSDAGCQRCHVPRLETGDHPVRALRHQKVAAYTDLLLHDMGPELADICLGLATPSEFRTEPLMGLRHMPRFLHDGRAKTIEQAIDLHGGEGSAARDRFRKLPEKDRAALLEFLRSL